MAWPSLHNRVMAWVEHQAHDVQQTQRAIAQLRIAPIPGMCMRRCRQSNSKADDPKSCRGGKYLVVLHCALELVKLPASFALAELDSTSIPCTSSGVQHEWFSTFPHTLDLSCARCAFHV